MTVLKLADVELLRFKKGDEVFDVGISLARPSYSYLEVIMRLSRGYKVEWSRIAFDISLLKYSKVSLEQKILFYIEELFEPVHQRKVIPFEFKDLNIGTNWVKDSFFYKEGELFNPEFLVDTEDLSATPSDMFDRYKSK
ncbi:hypothetical protein [Phascolarctobacterium succinatutens]|uniref:hypothetical protein n=1 Tax=Phascolarctobacterium succinatutens TaxID=626940 RepID=UPI003FD83C75